MTNEDMLEVAALSDEPSNTVLMEAVNNAGDLLGLTDALGDHELRKALEKVVQEYASYQSIAGFTPSPKEQKRLITQLIGSLDKALDLLSAIAPEYRTTIDGMIDWETPEVSIPDPVAQIVRLRDATATFLRNYQPRLGAPVDLPLEQAIRALLPLVESCANGPVAISFNKNKDEGPALVSPTAKALGLLLRAVEPTLASTKIINMIEKVRRQPEESEDPLIAIFRGDPLSQLDASLHPGRHDPEQRAVFRNL